MKYIIEIIELIYDYNKKFRDLKTKNRIKITEEFINNCENIKKKKFD